MSKATKLTLQCGCSRRKVAYTKCFMTELQCTIAYGAYNLKDIFGGGQSSSAGMLADKMAEIYFPCTTKDHPCVSQVELFLRRKQKYNFLFDKGDKGVSTICKSLHQLTGKDICIDKECINQSMLTRKKCQIQLIYQQKHCCVTRRTLRLMQKKLLLSVHQQIRLTRILRELLPVELIGIRILNGHALGCIKN